MPLINNILQGHATARQSIDGVIFCKPGTVSREKYGLFYPGFWVLYMFYNLVLLTILYKSYLQGRSYIWSSKWTLVMLRQIVKPTKGWKKNCGLIFVRSSPIIGTVSRDFVAVQKILPGPKYEQAKTVSETFRFRKDIRF